MHILPCAHGAITENIPVEKADLCPGFSHSPIGSGGDRNSPDLRTKKITNASAGIPADSRVSFVSPSVCTAHGGFMRDFCGKIFSSYC